MPSKDDPLNKAFQGLVPQDGAVSPRLMSLTVSTVRKRQCKKTLLPLPPFRAGGGTRGRSEIEDRRLAPGLHDTTYEGPVLVQRQEHHIHTSRFLHGPFRPTSTKPIWQTLAPMSYKRLPPTCEFKAVHAPMAQYRRKALPSTAPALHNKSLDDCKVPSEARPMTTTAVSRPTTGASPKKGGNSAARVSIGNAESIAAAFTRISSDNHVNAEAESSPRPAMNKRRSQRQSRLGSMFEKDSDARPQSPLIPIFLSSDPVEKYAESSDEMKVFRRFQDDNMVHKDDLPKCLVTLGYAYPRLDWIPEILKPITMYSQMSKEKFFTFVENYRLKQRESHKADFLSMDDDGSGTLDKDEFANLLHSFGIWPMSHVLEEVLAEVDEDGTGNLDFDEFEKVVQLLRNRQGFSLSEYEEILQIFQLFDRDQTGSMESSDFRVALDWLGFNLSHAQVTQIIQEIDEDSSGQIDELEWVTGMRKVRETKVAELQHIMTESDVDGDGSIQFDELTPLLYSLGYFPDEQAVREAATAAGIAEDDPGLDVGEMWRFMKVYRNREGLTASEVQEIEAGFLHNGVDPDGEVNTMQIGKIVRSIGYMISFDMMQNLIAKVDINNSGELDQREFRKMIRSINQRDIEVFKLAYHEAAEIKVKSRDAQVVVEECTSEDPTQYHKRIWVDGAEASSISVIQARRGLKRLGCMDCNGKLETLRPSDKVGPDEVDLFGFCTAARRSRTEARAAFRSNGGFSSEDISDMERSFKKYDSDGSGQLAGAEIASVLQDHFPTLASDPSRRPLIRQLLMEADRDGNNALDFGDFLRLMRQVKDIQDQLMIAKELQAIEETRFSPSEVLEFRELLLVVRGESKEIGFGEVKMLLGAIVPMGAQNVMQLKQTFREVAMRQAGVEGSQDKLDFPEFLWLMRELLDMNFAHMTDRVREMNERSQDMSRKSTEGSD